MGVLVCPGVERGGGRIEVALSDDGVGSSEMQRGGPGVARVMGEMGAKSKGIAGSAMMRRGSRGDASVRARVV